MRIVRATTQTALEKEKARLRRKGWLDAGENKRAAPCDEPNSNGEHYCLMARPKS